jgi:hypothetical protein
MLAAQGSQSGFEALVADLRNLTKIVWFESVLNNPAGCGGA